MSTIALHAAPGRRLVLWREGDIALWIVTVLTLAFVAAVITGQIGPWRTQTLHPATGAAQQPPSPRLLDQRVLPISAETAAEVNAARPIVAGAVVPAQPFRFAGTPAMLERATDCLAAAGWYEAGDDASGQRAVMQVILNRARHPSFPSTVCGVVFEGSSRATGCQFTFTCDGAIVGRTPSAAAWQRARAAAAAALAGTVDARVGYATFYHANYVVPYWAASFDKNAQVGLHLFYRWKGFWGTRGAFRQQVTGDEPALAAMARFASASTNPDGIPPPVLDPATVAAELGTPAVPPPPIAVEGVREKSLRGALVRGHADNQFFLQLDPAVFPGNYATASVALCRGKPSCTVLGWRDPAQMGGSLPLTDAQRAGLSFYFVANGDGAFRAVWNCQQTPRSNQAQCLAPAGPLPQLG
ncbi:cell wall hydrolase [Sphingomonas sp.]|uniref:cell wall hydrolase n=1 Tax=Sphingomonas sp. TaxID=28214 RepID=UPI003CC63A32